MVPTRRVSRSRRRWRTLWHHLCGKHVRVWRGLYGSGPRGKDGNRSTQLQSAADLRGQQRRRFIPRSAVRHHAGGRDWRGHNLALAHPECRDDWAESSVYTFNYSKNSQNVVPTGPLLIARELRHTFATLSADGVAGHLVTQMLRQGDARVFKRYSPDEVEHDAGSPGPAGSAGE